MSFQYLKLGIDILRYINILGRVEIHTRKRVHIVNGHHPGHTRGFGMIVGQCCCKARVKHERGYRRMIRHVVIRVMANDKVGIHLLDHIHNLVTGSFVVIIDLQAIKAAVDHLNASHRCRAFSLCSTDLGQLIRRKNQMTEVAAGQVAHNYTVSPGLTL